MTDDSSHLRMIAIDLLDEVFAEGRDAWKGINEMEHHDAQGDALMFFGEQRLRDPKTVARALIIAIADQLGRSRLPAT